MESPEVKTTSAFRGMDVNEWDVKSILGYHLVEQLYTREVVSQRIYLAKPDLMSHQYDVSTSSDRVAEGGAPPKSVLILTGSATEIDHEKEILLHIKQCSVSSEDWQGYTPLIEGSLFFLFLSF